MQVSDIFVLNLETGTNDLRLPLHSCTAPPSRTVPCRGEGAMSAGVITPGRSNQVTVMVEIPD
jgi:hypothetical protein